MKNIQIRFASDPTKVHTYKVKSIGYNRIRAVRLEYASGDIEYLNFDVIFSVKELA